MGSCCAPSSKQKVADRTPSHIRHRQLNSTFKQIKSTKEQSLISKQRHLYLVNASRILIYNIDMNIAWSEELSMRDSVEGRYVSVKTGLNQLFLVQGTLALLIDVDLFTAIRKVPPPFPITRSSMCYYDRKVYVAGERLIVLDLDTDDWSELLMPTNYSQESGCFLLENKLYLMGGIRDNLVRRDVLVYSLLARSWLSSTIELPLPMRLPTCVAIDNSQALVCCGFTPQNTPISQTYIFDLYKFELTESVSAMFESPPLMAICYHRTCFLMREDGVIACWQNGEWFDIDAEATCHALLGVDTVETANRDTDELESARALIPKRPPRPDRLYCYCGTFEDRKFMVEMNVLSLDSKRVDEERFLAAVPKHAGYGLLPNGKVLFAGGEDDAMRELDTVLEYDGAAVTITGAPPLPVPQAFVAITCAGDKAFALGSHTNVSQGGKTRRQAIESFFQEFHISSSLWLPLPQPPVALLHHALCHLGGLIFSFGGAAITENRTVHQLILEFSTVKKEWRTLETKYPSAAGSLSTVNTLQNRVVCFGGVDLVTGQMLEETWSFDGKGFKAKSRCSFQGKACLGCVGYKPLTKHIFAVDIAGTWHRYSIDTGAWEHGDMPTTE